MRRFFILFFLLISLGIQAQNTLPKGTWRFTLLSDGGEIPFLVEFATENNKPIAYILNAEERLKLDQVQVTQDSIKMPLHIFDAALIGKLEKNTIKGVFRKYYAPDKDQNFVATPSSKRFVAQSGSRENKFEMTGKWEVEFKDPQTGKTTASVGTFKQNKEQVITGSFLTASGDYRYLEGRIMDKNTLQLSTFDGNHTYLFKAKVIDANTLEGEFWSGQSAFKTWKAVRNPNASLPDAYSLVQLKDGQKTIDFKLPDLQGNLLSPNDPKYQGKVRIIQIFGTWCPNCMDETPFLADWYNKNKNQPVAIIGLAFERKNDINYARPLIERMKKRFNVGYDFVFGGAINNTLEVLTALSKAPSFPTTIFIDKKGQVRKIHTGFSGPGTGEYFIKWREEFNALMSELLREEGNN